MSDQEATNPVAEEEAVPSTEAQGVADEAQAQGDDQDQGNEAEGEGDEAQAEADDTEEIDVDGVKARVPKALKDAFLRQADYTRKTQEVAEQRRALEARNAELAQQAEARTQTLEQRVQLGLLDKQLEAFAELDWDEYAQNYGANAAISAQAKWRQIEAQRASLNNEITEAESNFRLSSERAAATVLQEADKELAQVIEGYGPELVQSVAKVGQTFGFSPDELRESFIGADGKPDTRSFRVLARLHALEAENATLRSKQTKAATAEKQAKVQPAKTVSANAGQYKAGLDDTLPTDEWVRRFNAQRKRA